LLSTPLSMHIGLIFLIHFITRRYSMVSKQHEQINKTRASSTQVAIQSHCNIKVSRIGVKGSAASPHAWQWWTLPFGATMRVGEVQFDEVFCSLIQCSANWMLDTRWFELCRYTEGQSYLHGCQSATSYAIVGVIRKRWSPPEWNMTRFESTRHFCKQELPTKSKNPQHL
jgi:hypothetical protein